jgi:flagellar protein FlaG
MSSEISPLPAQRPQAFAPVAQPSPHGAGHPQAEPPQTSAAAKPSAQAQQQTRANIREAMERLNQQMRQDGRKLNFSMDEVADRVVITVRKTDTGEVVRQIPDESLLRVAHNIEALKGLLHNEVT